MKLTLAEELELERLEERFLGPKIEGIRRAVNAEEILRRAAPEIKTQEDLTRIIVDLDRVVELSKKKIASLNLTIAALRADEHTQNLS